MAQSNFYISSSERPFGLTATVVTRQGQGKTGIVYQIMGTTVQSLLFWLEPGQVVYTEGGGIGWMSPNIVLNTKTREGGIGTMVKHAVFGKSLFLVEYNSQNEGGTLTFTSSFPGRIVPIHLEIGEEIIVQRKRFLCAEASVTIELCFQKTLTSSLLGGIDFAMQRLSGEGVAFVCFNGDSVVYELAAQQILKVDPELVAMYDPTVKIDVEMISGYKNILFSGRKIWQTTLCGPGRVFLQTMAIQKLAKALSPYLPNASTTRITTEDRDRRRPRTQEKTRQEKRKS